MRATASLSSRLVPSGPHLPQPQPARAPIFSVQAHGRGGDAAREACTLRSRSAGSEPSDSEQRAQRCPLASVSCSRLPRRAATATAPPEDGQELGLRSSALLLASFLAFTALPAYASDGTGAAASEAIGVLNQVATTLTGLAVAFLGGVAILMRPMQSDISTLKADVGQLKADVGELKSLKTDVGQLKLNLNVSTLLTITGFVSLGVLVFTTSR